MKETPTHVDTTHTLEFLTFSILRHQRLRAMFGTLQLYRDDVLQLYIGIRFPFLHGISGAAAAGIRSHLLRFQVSGSAGQAHTNCGHTLFNYSDTYIFEALPHYNPNVPGGE